MDFRPIPEIAYAFVKGGEACVLRVYDDARPKHILVKGDVADGRLTGGWGHTDPALRYDTPVDATIAKGWLVADMTKAAVRLAGCVKREAIDALSEHEYAALLAFVFNAGAGAAWQIWKHVNKGLLNLVPQDLMAFDHGHVDGVLVEIPGLKHRRMAEITLWSAPDVKAAVAVVQAAPVAPPPSSVTRLMETPPQVAPASNTKNGGMISGGIGVVVAGGGAVVQGVQGASTAVSSALQPFADKSDQVAQWVTWAVEAGAVAAVVGMALVWLDGWRKRHQGGGSVA